MHKYILSEVAFKDKQKDEQFFKRKYTRSKYDQVTHLLVLGDRNMIITLHFALCMKIFQIVNKLFPFSGYSLSINMINYFSSNINANDTELERDWCNLSTRSGNR